MIAAKLSLVERKEAETKFDKMKLDYFFCVCCIDKTTGKNGDFVFSSEAPFVAISPVFNGLQDLFNWMKNKYEIDTFQNKNNYVPFLLKKIN